MRANISRYSLVHLLSCDIQSWITFRRHYVLYPYLNFPRPDPYMADKLHTKDHPSRDINLSHTPKTPTNCTHYRYCQHDCHPSLLLVLIPFRYGWLFSRTSWGTSSKARDGLENVPRVSIANLSRGDALMPKLSQHSRGGLLIVEAMPASDACL